MGPPPGETDFPLDDLLRPRPAPPADVLRRTLLERTSRRVHFRRQLRRAALVAAAVLVYAGGLATAWLARPPAPEPAVIVVQVPAPAPPAPAPPEKPPAVAPEPKSPPSPAELELEAERTLVRGESARRFREAGDGYLSAGDLQAAVRCYRNFLDEAEEAERAVSSEDSWLLISLKSARSEEN